MFLIIFSPSDLRYSVTPSRRNLLPKKPISIIVSCLALRYSIPVWVAILQMAKLESSWNVHHSAREPHSVIRVSSLHVDLPAVRDAWGRYPKSQPALITCAVSLHQPFTSASAKDAVTSSTIHYGNLSKAIIEACHRFSDICPISPMPLSLLLHYIQSWLTGVNSMDDKKFELLAIPLIEPMGVELLTLEIFLPKASLLGSGVKMEEAFRYNRGKIAIESYSVMLEICCLKIPVIIGVNQNEKLAKQVVVVSIQIDFYDTTFGEDFYELEQIIVKVIFPSITCHKINN